MSDMVRRLHHRERPYWYLYLTQYLTLNCARYQESRTVTDRRDYPYGHSAQCSPRTGRSC